MRTSVQRVWMHHVALFAVLGVVACGARSDGAPRPTAEHVSSASQPLVSVTTMSSFGGMSGVGQPRGEPLLSGSALYGVSFAGGAFGLGTVYKVNTDGNDYVVLHSFAGGATGGRNPAHGLVQSGSTLYGTTSGDSNTDKGTIFKIDTDGTGFAVLHSFAGAPSSGDPSGRLVTLAPPSTG